MNLRVIKCICPNCKGEAESIKVSDEFGVTRIGFLCHNCNRREKAVLPNNEKESVKQTSFWFASGNALD